MSTIRFPQRNLSPDSNNWAKTIEKNLQELSQSLKEQQQSTNRALSGLSGAFTVIERIEGEVSENRKDFLEQKIANDENIAITAVASAVAENPSYWMNYRPNEVVDDDGAYTDFIPETTSATWYLIDDQGVILEIWKYVTDPEDAEGYISGEWVQQDLGWDTLDEDITGTITEAFDKADEAYFEALDEMGRVQQALDAAFAAQGGVQGALNAVVNLGETLTPMIDAAQIAANSAASDLTDIFDDVLIRGTGGNIRLRDSTVTAPNIVASESLSAKVAQFLEIETGTISWDNAAGNRAFIGSLIGNDAFLEQMYANRVIVGPQDFAPGPGGYQDVYTVGAGNAIAVSPPTNTNPDPSGYQFQMYPETTTNGAGRILGPRLPVTTGQKIVFRAYVDGSGTPDGRIRVYMIWSDDEDDTSVTSWDAFTYIDSNGWFEGTVTVPEGKQFGRLAFSGLGEGTKGNYNIRQVICRPQASSTLIEDGAITTDKIFAGAVTAETVAANAITTDKLAANSITAKHTITGSEIVGAVVTGGVITGALIQTDAQNQTGIKLTSSALRGYDSSGNLVMDINPGGTNLLVGRLRTNVTGSPGIVLLNYTSAGQVPGIWFSADGSTSSSQAAIYPNDNYEMVIRNRKVGSGTGGPVIMDPGGYAKSMFAVGGSSSYAYEGVFMGDSSTGSRLDAGRVSAQGNRGKSSGLWLLNTPASTASANAVISTVSPGKFYRSTSLRAAKMNIRPIEDRLNPYDVLNVEVRDWLDRDQVEGREEAMERRMLQEEGFDVADSEISLQPLKRIPGVIAEEVLDAGLQEFCTWDEEGNLMGVMYDRLPLLLIPIVKELVERVETLERQKIV